MEEATSDAALTEASLVRYLRAVGLARPGERLAVETAGDGNINWVRRVRSLDLDRSWIVKQARPALERFPQYRASTERIVFEHRWFAVAAAVDRDAVRPRILHFDERARVLVLEDLGDAERLDRALLRGRDAARELRTVARLLGAVHATTTAPEIAARFGNDEMRALHGAHIFDLPFRANDFPLSPWLRAAASGVQADRELTRLAEQAHARYLEPRGSLLHGDVQAGNVLLAPEGPKLLDAEIAHVGDPAFDVGMLIAHVLLAAVGRGEPAAARGAVTGIWEEWAAARGSGAENAFAEAARIAGFEVMRRTIGAARVAAVEADAAGLSAVELAARLIRRPPGDPADLGGMLSSSS